MSSPNVVPGRIRLAADWVVPVSGPPIERGVVEILDGRIERVDHEAGQDSEVLRRFPGAAIVPGFVSAHTHLACGFLKGLGQDLEFPDWLLTVVGPRVKSALDEGGSPFAGAARTSLRDLVASGVTLVGDAFLAADGLDALGQAGIPGAFFLEFFGASAADPASYVDEALAAFDARFGAAERDAVGLSLHSPYLCPSVVVSRVAAHARSTGRRLSIHLDESRDEHLLFAESRGRLYDALARTGPMDRYLLGRTPAAALDELGALSEKTLLAHAIHVTNEDVGLIARSGASVVHCPTSNAMLANGIAPIAALLESGINVALGVDSSASNGKLDMIEEMRLAVLLHRARTGSARTVTAEAVLRMATLGGARALGRGGVSGSLEPGKRADLVVVDLSKDRHRPVRDPVAAIVFSGTADDVLETWIGGRPVHVRSPK